LHRAEQFRAQRQRTVTLSAAAAPSKDGFIEGGQIVRQVFHVLLQLVPRRVRSYPSRTSGEPRIGSRILLFCILCAHRNRYRALANTGSKLPPVKRRRLARRRARRCGPARRLVACLARLDSTRLASPARFCRYFLPDGGQAGLRVAALAFDLAQHFTGNPAFPLMRGNRSAGKPTNLS
jgi:hypothetical protein